MDLELSSKVIIITGGNSGIGEGAARLLAREGALVVVAARRRDEGEAVAASIRADGGEALFVACDVSEEVQVDAVVAAALDRFGRLDGAFNNAGIELPWTDLDAATKADWDKTIAINLTGVWLCIRAQVRAMRKLGVAGSIVNCSSWQAYGGLEGGAAYCASKAGLDGLMRAIAIETGPQGIRINNLAPGNIDTPMVRSFAPLDDPRLKPFKDLTPLKRFGSIDEIADSAAWLLSARSSFVHGETIVVDGGFGRIGGPLNPPVPLQGR